MSGNHVCPWWLAYTFDNPLRRLIHNPVKIFENHVFAGMTVMDVGCGMGYFSLGLAGIVGDTGKVLSVDLQQKMLDILRKRVSRAGLSHIIETHLCEADDINIHIPVDFILAFWMVHETPDPEKFFAQAASILKPGGKLLFAEPSFHVSQIQYNEICAAAEIAGFFKSRTLAIHFSRAIILEREADPIK